MSHFGYPIWAPCVPTNFCKVKLVRPPLGLFIPRFSIHPVYSKREKRVALEEQYRDGHWPSPFFILPQLLASSRSLLLTPPLPLNLAISPSPSFSHMRLYLYLSTLYVSPLCLSPLYLSQSLSRLLFCSRSTGSFFPCLCSPFCVINIQGFYGSVTPPWLFIASYRRDLTSAGLYFISSESPGVAERRDPPPFRGSFIKGIERHFVDHLFFRPMEIRIELPRRPSLDYAAIRDLCPRGRRGNN